MSLGLSSVLLRLFCLKRRYDLSCQSIASYTVQNKRLRYEAERWKAAPENRNFDGIGNSDYWVIVTGRNAAPTIGF
jgi:hypothetical protein